MDRLSVMNAISKRQTGAREVRQKRPGLAPFTFVEPNVMSQSYTSHRGKKEELMNPTFTLSRINALSASIVYCYEHPQSQTALPYQLSLGILQLLDRI